jgi:hypothetical protein
VLSFAHWKIAVKKSSIPRRHSVCVLPLAAAVSRIRSIFAVRTSHFLHGTSQPDQKKDDYKSDTNAGAVGLVPGVNKFHKVDHGSDEGAGGGEIENV